MRSIFAGIALAVMAVGAAGAADLAVKAPPIPYAASPTWTGFYAGLSAGGAWGDVIVRDTNGGVAPGPFGYNVTGGYGGGQLGYNYAITPWLLVGVEGQVGYLGLTGKGIIGSSVATAHQDLTLDSGVIADISGRIGVTFGQFLVYGKGGGAWFNGKAGQTTTNPGYVTTSTSTFNGWTAGGGLEYLISPNWSAKAEYQYYDFGNQGGYQTNVGDLTSPIGFKFNNDHALKMNVIRLGLNYHFK